MKTIFSLFLLLAWVGAYAECDSELPVSGALSMASCNPKQGKCLSVSEALLRYAQAYPDRDDVLLIASQASPWHFYDENSRIMPVNVMADSIRGHLHQIKKVVLLSSWSGVRPHAGVPSLAEKLAQALAGFPVEGQAGFLWLTPNGGSKTTRQRYSVVKGSPYRVQNGAEVMAAMQYADPLSRDEQALSAQDAQGVFYAGAAWEILGLCPQKAMLRFATAAKLNHPVAAYNWAVMLLETGRSEDAQAARKILESVASQDQPAQALLAQLSAKK